MAVIAEVDRVRRFSPLFQSETDCFEMKQLGECCRRDTAVKSKGFYGMRFAL
jgi:hypothetical protein